MLKLCKRFLLLLVLAMSVLTLIGCGQPEVKVEKTLQISDSSLVLTVGESKTLSAKYFEDGVEAQAEIAYKTSNLGVASLAGASVKGVSAGSAVITAYVVGHDDINADCSVLVNKEIVEPEVIITHALTIDTDGGVYANAPTKFVEGVALRLQAPKKDGYRFLGYQKGDELVMGLTGEDKADVSLKAVWEKIDERVPLTTTFAALDMDELKALVPASGNKASEKKYAIGYVAEVSDTTNGVLSIEDAEGNKLVVNGLYDQDNELKYASMALKPVEGDIIVIYGYVENNNGALEMKDAALVEFNGYTLAHSSKERSVALILGDGKVEKDITSYTIGDQITLPTPVKEGYKFLGWYCNDKKVTEIKATDKENFVFVAKWEKIVTKTYTATYDLNGAKLESNFGIKAGATPVKEFGIVKSGASYAATVAELAYVAHLDTLNPLNGLRWQGKVYLKYNEAYKAYEIILVDNATANSANLGMLGVADYVIGGSKDAAVSSMFADKSYEHRFIVFDQDITTLANGDVAVVAKVYDKEAFGDSNELVTSLVEGNEYPLPTPSKGQYEKFLGWFDGDSKVEKLVANKNYNLVAKFEKVVINHAVTLNLGEDEYIPYKVATGDSLAKLHITKFNGSYANIAKEAYVASIVNNLAEGCNALRWQYKLVVKYDEAAGAYKIVGVDAGTMKLEEMNVDGDYVIATLADEKLINLSANKDLVGKYVSFQADLETLQAGDADFYAFVVNSALDLTDGGVVTSYVEGELTALPLLTREGYWRFIGWTDGKSTFNAIAEDQKTDLVLNPVWEEIIIKHNITWDLDGGECENLPKEFVEGSENIVLPTPTKEGFEFIGWLINDITVTEINCSSKEDVSVKAVWLDKSIKIQNFNLELDLAGGTLTTEAPTSYTFGVGLNLPTPTKEHFTFAGWYKGETLIAKISKIQTGDLKLTAKWERIKHNITYVLSDGVLEEEAPESYEEGIGVTLKGASKQYFTFEGWYIGEVKYEAIGEEACEDIVLTAKWTRNTHSITYVIEGIPCDEINPKSYEEGIGLATLPAATPTAEWKIFAGWYVEDTKVTSIPATATADYTLTARFNDAMAKIGATYYATFNAAMQNAKDNDVITLHAGEHLLTTKSTAKVIVEGPNKGIRYDGERSPEATIFVNQSTSDNYGLSNASIIFDGVEISSKYTNTSLFYPVNTCLYAEFRNVIIDSKYTGTANKINSFLRMNNHLDAGMEIKIIDSAIYDVDQFVIWLQGTPKSVANILSCDIKSYENIGSQLFRIKSGNDSIINVMDCTIDAVKSGYVCKAEAGYINIMFNTITNNNAASHLKPTCDGVITYEKNYFKDSSNTSGSKLSSESTRAQAYYDYQFRRDLTLNANGGKLLGEPYKLKDSAVALKEFTIKKSNPAYANTAKEAYIGSLAKVNPINGLRWQGKIYLKYNEAYKAYEIILVDNATANSSSLGMLDQADYVIGGSEDAVVPTIYADKSYEHKFIVFDKDITTLSEGDVSVSAKVYAATDFALSPVDLPYKYYINDEDINTRKLPVLTKEGETFIGWLNEEGKLVSTYKELNEKDVVLNAVFAKHLINWSDGTEGSQYTSTKWTQEQYDTQWKQLSGQMNCRNKDGMRVVNLVGGYSMTRRFTYNPGASIGKVNAMFLYVGNYFSGAKEIQAKIVLIDKDGNSKYVAGTSDQFISIPVTSGMIPFAFTFDDFEVSQVRFVMKSTISGNAYLYVGPVAFAYFDTMFNFRNCAASNNSYTNTWKYNDITIVGGGNNTGTYPFVKMGGKKANQETLGINPYMALPALKKDAKEIKIAIGGYNTTAIYNADDIKCSIKIECYSDAELKTKLSETASQEILAQDKGTPATEYTFTGDFKKGNYIKVVFECANSTDTNGIVAVQYITLTA